VLDSWSTMAGGGRKAAAACEAKRLNAKRSAGATRSAPISRARRRFPVGKLGSSLFRGLGDLGPRGPRSRRETSVAGAALASLVPRSGGSLLSFARPLAPTLSVGEARPHRLASQLDPTCAAWCYSWTNPRSACTARQQDPARTWSSFRRKATAGGGRARRGQPSGVASHVIDLRSRRGSRAAAVIREAPPTT